MINWRNFIGVVALIAITAAFGCREEPVGAPCFPESDDGSFKEQKGTTDLIETRSVQCETRTCVTRTTSRNDIDNKYSFCSCKCKNLEGHEVDKEEDLCECPPNTRCSEVSFPIDDTPDKVLGRYCIPSCIIEGCVDDSGLLSENYQCTPSRDSDKPWNWKCRTVSGK